MQRGVSFCMVLIPEPPGTVWPEASIAGTWWRGSSPACGGSHAGQPPWMLFKSGPSSLTTPRGPSRSAMDSTQTEEAQATASKLSSDHCKPPWTLTGPPQQCRPDRPRLRAVLWPVIAMICVRISGDFSRLLLRSHVLQPASLPSEAEALKLAMLKVPAAAWDPHVCGLPQLAVNIGRGQQRRLSAMDGGRGGAL